MSNVDAAAFAALLASSCGLLHGCIEFRRSLKAQREELFFWGGSIYFALIPLTIDAIVMVSGQLEEMNLLLEASNDFYWTGLNSEILLHAALFTVIFNLVFSIMCLWLRHPRNAATSLRWQWRFGGAGAFTLISLTYLAAYVCLAEGVDFIYNQKNDVTTSTSSAISQLLLPACGLLFLQYASERKYITAIIAAFPLVAVSFAAQSRANFIYLPVAALMLHLIVQNGRISLGKLGIFALVVLVLSVAVKAAYNPNHGFWLSDNTAGYFVANVFRDVSISDFYFAVNTQMEDPQLTTGGKSTLALLAIGIIPPFLAPELFAPANTVTYAIYQLRFGEYAFGSMHPTLYGNAFFDLGYGGLLIAIVMPLALQAYRALTSRFSFSAAMPVIMISSFYLVALRGSTNVAYAKLVFSSVVIFVLLYIAQRIDKFFKRPSNNMRDKRTNFS